MDNFKMYDRAWHLTPYRDEMEAYENFIFETTDQAKEGMENDD